MPTGTPARQILRLVSYCDHPVTCVAAHRPKSASPSVAATIKEQGRSVLGSLVCRIGQDAGVGVGGSLDRGVPEHRGHCLQAGARSQHQARGTIPKIVQSDRRQPCGALLPVVMWAFDQAGSFSYSCW